MVKYFCDICKKETCQKNLHPVSLPVFRKYGTDDLTLHRPDHNVKEYKKIDFCDECLTKCARKLYELGIWN